MLIYWSSLDGIGITELDYANTNTWSRILFIASLDGIGMKELKQNHTVLLNSLMEIFLWFGSYTLSLYSREVRICNSGPAQFFMDL